MINPGLKQKIGIKAFLMAVLLVFSLEGFASATASMDAVAQQWMKYNSEQSALEAGHRAELDGYRSDSTLSDAEFQAKVRALNERTLAESRQLVREYRQPVVDALNKIANQEAATRSAGKISDAISGSDGTSATGNKGGGGFSDVDQKGGARTVDKLNAAVRDLNVSIEKIHNANGGTPGKAPTLSIEGEGGYSTVKELKLTTHKMGPMGTPGTAAHQMQINVDAASAETSVNYGMEKNQAGRIEVEVNDVIKKATKGLSVDSQELLKTANSENLHDMLKGTGKALDIIDKAASGATDAQIEKILKSNNLDMTPAEFKKMLAEVKPSHAIGPEGHNITSANIENIQNTCRDIAKEVSSTAKTMADAEVVAREAELKSLRESGNTAKANKVAEELVDTKVRREATRAVVTERLAETGVSSTAEVPKVPATTSGPAKPGAIKEFFTTDLLGTKGGKFVEGCVNTGGAIMSMIGGAVGGVQAGNESYEKKEGIVKTGLRGAAYALWYGLGGQHSLDSGREGGSVSMDMYEIEKEIDKVVPGSANDWYYWSWAKARGAGWGLMNFAALPQVYDAMTRIKDAPSEWANAPGLIKDLWGQRGAANMESDMAERVRKTQEYYYQTPEGKEEMRDNIRLKKLDDNFEKMKRELAELKKLEGKTWLDGGVSGDDEKKKEKGSSLRRIKDSDGEGTGKPGSWSDYFNRKMGKNEREQLLRDSEETTGAGKLYDSLSSLYDGGKKVTGSWWDSYFGASEEKEKSEFEATQSSSSLLMDERNSNLEATQGRAEAEAAQRGIGMQNMLTALITANDSARSEAQWKRENSWGAWLQSVALDTTKAVSGGFGSSFGNRIGSGIIEYEIWKREQKKLQEQTPVQNTQPGPATSSGSTGSSTQADNTSVKNTPPETTPVNNNQNQVATKSTPVTVTQPPQQPATTSSGQSGLNFTYKPKPPSVPAPAHWYCFHCGADLGVDGNGTCACRSGKK